jgi:hypothetical protein
MALMPRLANRIPGLGRLLRRGQADSTGPQGQSPTEAEDPLLALGRRLREEREARGLNLRQLALETRISTPVLEALERGWRDRLPEGAYLRTMLPLLEQHLQLPAGCLHAALPAEARRPQPRGGRGGLLQRFTPGSIDVFSTWQGTVIYGALCLGLIYALNLQQQRLAAANLLSLRPIPPLPAAEQSKPASPGTSLLQAYPELRPLAQARAGLSQAALRQLERQGDSRSPGVLQLNLSQASSLHFSSEAGSRSSLKGAQGELVLQLQPPLQVAITPAPKPGEVLWNGQPLPALVKQPGQYRLPAPVASGRGAAPAPPAPAAAP